MFFFANRVKRAELLAGFHISEGDVDKRKNRSW